MKTDREIQEEVLAALEWEPGVHAAHVGVSVRNGIVTPQGFVRSIGEKRLAERIAGRVYSVRNWTRNGCKWKRTTERSFCSVRSISLTEREAAEHAAWSAPGVISVEDRLVVTP